MLDYSAAWLGFWVGALKGIVCNQEVEATKQDRGVHDFETELRCDAESRRGNYKSCATGDNVFSHISLSFNISCEYIYSGIY